MTRRSRRALRRSLRAGFLPRVRPDRLLRARSTLLRWGATPAGACHAAAICDPDRVAIADEHTTLTCAEVDRRTSSLAAALRARGYGPGDTVAIMCANHHWLVETHIAASKLAMNVLYLDPQDDPAHVAHVLAEHRPRLLVHDEDCGEALR